MQTFLPYFGFAASAQTLDRQRLGKQRVETLQIAKVIAGQSTGWANHPAVKMWQGHHDALLAYQFAVCKFWTDDRGYNDTCLDKTVAVLAPHLKYIDPATFRTKRPLGLQMELDEAGLLPLWLGNAEFHLSHRSNLLRKDPDWYRAFWDGDPEDLSYFWPTEQGVSA